MEKYGILMSILFIDYEDGMDEEKYIELFRPTLI